MWFGFCFLLQSFLSIPFMLDGFSLFGFFCIVHVLVSLYLLGCFASVSPPLCGYGLRSFLVALLSLPVFFYFGGCSIFLLGSNSRVYIPVWFAARPGRRANNKLSSLHCAKPSTGPLACTRKLSVVLTTRFACSALLASSGLR